MVSASRQRAFQRKLKRADQAAQAGRAKEAVDLYGHLVTEATETFGPASPITLTAREDLALAYLALGQLNDARELLVRIVPELDAACGAEHRLTVTARMHLAVVHGMGGEHQTAHDLLSADAVRSVRLFGANDALTVKIQQNLAHASAQLSVSDTADTAGSASPACPAAHPVGGSELVGQEMTINKRAGGRAEAAGKMWIRSAKQRVTRFHAWLQVDVDEPMPITGILDLGNRRMSDRLWAELLRVGVTKRDVPGSEVRLAGEVGMGTNVAWLSSSFLIGIVDPNGSRIFAFTGTSSYVGHSWNGSPSRAFELLARIPTAGGPDGFWQAFTAGRSAG